MPERGFMKPIFAALLLLAAPLAAQQHGIDPSQIKPGANGQSIQTVGGKSAWGNSSTSVPSVFTRTGPITAQAGDYNCSQVTGAICSLPSLFNQTVGIDGTAVTQRSTLNFINGSAGSVSCVDNPVTGATDCTFTGGSSAGITYSIADVAGSRSVNTAYQNTSSSPMYIGGSIGTSGSGVGNVGVAQGLTSMSMPLINWANQATATVSSGDAGFSAMIMPGYWYTVIASGAVNGGVHHWTQITSTGGGGGGGGGAPGGSNHSVQFNQSTAFGGTAFNGLLKASTTADPSAATDGTDYLSPATGLSSLTGDVTTSAHGAAATTLATVNSNVGSCGDATHVAQVTLDAKGRSTACTPVAITGGGSYTPPTGTGFPHVTSGAQDPAARAVDLSSADATGTLAGAREPAHTADVTNTAGSLAMKVVAINNTNLAGLGTGIVKNTTGTGVPSIAVAADFPTLNQSTTGSAAKLTTPRSINGTAFDGTANITVTAVPSGTCGGALTGTFPNCTIAGLGSAGFIPQSDGAGNFVASVGQIDAANFLNLPVAGINIVGSFPGGGAGPFDGLPGIYMSNTYCGNVGMLVGGDTGDTENGLQMGHNHPCNSSGEFGPADTSFLLTTGSAHAQVGGVTATITNVSSTSTVITFTAANSFTTSQFVFFQGLTVASFLNGTAFAVQSPTSSQFAITYSHSPISSTAETGTAQPYVDNVLNLGSQGTGQVNLGPYIAPLIALRSGLSGNGIFFPQLAVSGMLFSDATSGQGKLSVASVYTDATKTMLGVNMVPTHAIDAAAPSSATTLTGTNAAESETTNTNGTVNTFEGIAAKSNNSSAAAVTMSKEATVNVAVTAGAESGDKHFLQRNAGTLTDWWTMFHDGGMASAGVTGGDKGPGTINAAAIYQNGVAIAGGAVTSVFGRTGVVAATSGDYTVGQVTSAASTIAPNTFTQTAAGLGNIFTQFTGATTTCANNVITFAVNGVNDGCLYRNTGSLFFRFGVAPTTGVVNGWGFDEQLAVVGAITASGTVTSNLGTAAITSATGGTGVTSVTCATAACDVSRGTYTVVGGSATTGVIVTLVWPTTTTAWVCSVDGQGVGVSFQLSHSVATATGMTISAAVSISGQTFSLDYQCVP